MGRLVVPLVCRNSATSSATGASRLPCPVRGSAASWIAPAAPRFVSYYILHRKAREDSILHRLSKGTTDIPTIVRAIYIGIDPRLTGAAGLSVLAHLEDLVARGVVETDGQPAIDGVYRLAG